MDKEQKRQEVIFRLFRSTRTRKRPVSIVQVALDIEWLQNDMGSLEEVAKIVKISTRMLRRFLSVRRLSPQVQKLVEERKIDSVTIVHNLENFDEKEQELIAKEIIANCLNSRDVRILSPLKHSNPDLSIEELITRVQQSKDIKTYVAYFEVPERIKSGQVLRKKFEDIVGQEEIVNFKIRNHVGELELSSSGLKKLRNKAKKSKLTLKRFIENMIHNLT